MNFYDVDFKKLCEQSTSTKNLIIIEPLTKSFKDGMLIAK